MLTLIDIPATPISEIILGDAFPNAEKSTWAERGMLVRKPRVWVEGFEFAQGKEFEGLFFPWLFLVYIAYRYRYDSIIMNMTSFSMLFVNHYS